MKLAALILVAVALDLRGAVPVFAEKTTAYGPRRNRSDGLRAHPVSGYQLELISVLLDAPTSNSTLPESLSVEFYLGDSTHTAPGSIDIIVRESSYSNYYWLDRPVPASGSWRSGRNVFSWPTSDVLAAVDPEYPIAGLSALVVLGTVEPGRPIRTTPALLRGPAATGIPDVCLLTFRPGARCKLRVVVRNASGAEVFSSGSARNCDAELPADFLWPVKDLPSGTYRVEAQGTLLRTGAPVALTALVELPGEVVRGGK
jgi:hypothetical protein